jgi:hypothetical protein
VLDFDSWAVVNGTVDGLIIRKSTRTLVWQNREEIKMYDRPVTFTTTGQYGCGPENEDDVYTVEEFLQMIEC